jgi:anti-anti-sigma factor
MQYEVEDTGKFRMYHIIGNIDSDSSSKLIDDDISRCIAGGRHHFVFNLERTKYLDSAGISVFIHCLCDVQENNGSIFIIAHESQVRKVLEMVGITRLIKTYRSRKEFAEAHPVEVK